MLRLARFAVFVLISSLVYIAPVHAQATRTWVSGVGDDANPCSRTAPCKTFAGAISKTATGGEINCLDPAGYGAVTITKSITIDCAGTNGSILSANVTGIIVNGAGAVVTLRNLSINGAATTTGNGIRIINAGAVNIDHCRIGNFLGASPSNGRGIVIETSLNVRVAVMDSQLWNNNFIGIHSNPTSGNVTLSVHGVTIEHGGGTGIQLHQNTTATIDHTTITDHAVGAAITVELSNNATMISNSNLSNNQFGIFNGNGGAPTTRLSNTIITGNTTAGLSINNGSLVISHGNNSIRGNAGNEAPSSSVGTQ